MCPILITIPTPFGQIPIHTYGVLVAAGFLIGILLAERNARNYGIKKEVIADLGFYIVISALIGSRLLFVITEYKHISDLNENWEKFFKVWKGGLIFYGGLLAAVPTAIFYIRKQGVPVLKVADVFAPYMPLGHGIGRLGCFSAGCCYGNPTDSFFGVTFTHPNSLAPQGIPLHPTQLYEAFGNFSIFLILIAFRKKQTYSGQLFFLYGTMYSTLRFINEFFRGKDTKYLILNTISFSQLISVLFFTLSVFMLIYLKKKKTASTS